MRKVAAVAFLFATIGCSSKGDSVAPQGGGSSGGDSAATGDSTGSGGQIASAGTGGQLAGTGGTFDTGGKFGATGGTFGEGGRGSGGTFGTGGKSGATGGTFGEGGRDSGGTFGTGGQTTTIGGAGTGGAFGSGGQTSSTGGAPGSGGKSGATGGTMSTGGQATGGTKGADGGTGAHTNQISQAIIDEFVTAHNNARSGAIVALNPVPSPALPPVTWDPILGDSAYNYLVKCQSSNVDLVDHNANRSSDYVALGGTGYVGENIYAITGGATKPTDAVTTWMGEASSYNYSSNSGNAGHYTQVVWRDSVRIGCAVVNCPSMKYSNTILCDYSPGGNVNGQRPY